MLSEVIPTAIPLRRRDGSVRAMALVDTDDWHRFKDERCHLVAGRYASFKRAGKGVYLHRDLLGLEPGDGLEGDHINRNTLDCRRANLRIVTHAQNGQNVPAIGEASKHRGVYWHKARRKWVARVKLNGRVRASYFDDEAEAGEAARAWRQELLPFATE